MVNRHRPVTSAAIGGLLLLGASGCAPGPATAVPLDTATGAVLADAADRLAAALESERPCWALQEADALRDRASRALGDGEAPESVVEETIRVVDATTADLTCDDPDDGDAGDDEADTDDSPSGSTSEPAPAPAPAPAPSSGGGDDDSGGDGGRGPDGDGPPGQNRGGGNGGGPPAGRGGR